MKTNTEKKIIEAAYKLFTHLGFRNTKINDITNSAKISKATFYNYFDGKGQIFFVILINEVERLRKKIENAINQESDPHRKIRAFFISKIEGMRETLNRFDIQTKDIFLHNPIPKTLLEKMFNNELKMIKDILSYGKKKGVFSVKDLDFTAYVIVKGIQGFENPWVFENKELRIDEKVDAMLEVLFSGLSTNRIN